METIRVRHPLGAFSRAKRAAIMGRNPSKKAHRSPHVPKTGLDCGKRRVEVNLGTPNVLNSVLAGEHVTGHLASYR